MGAIQFKKKDLLAIEGSFVRFLDMESPDREAALKMIEEKDRLAVFGYGSLIANPHSDFDREHFGILPDYKRDGCCPNRYLRGLPNKLGITMGIVPAEGHEVRGLVRIVDLTKYANKKDEGNQKRESAADQVLMDIYKLAKREVSLNPIYAFRVMQIQTEAGPINAIVCDSDRRFRRFIGSTVEVDRGRNLTFEQKAAVIATSHGAFDMSPDERPSPRITGLGYWRFAGIHGANLAKTKPEPHIEKLVQIANAYRLVLLEHRPEWVAPLEALEDIPERKEFAPNVFAFDQRARRTKPHVIEQHLATAREKLGDQDPLPPDRREIIERNIKELAELTKLAA